MGDNGKDLSDKALFLSASWGDNGLKHGPFTKLPILNESIINDFYAKHLASRSDPKPSIFSTIVADKLDRDVTLSAQEAGVTLIPARRKARSTPKNDPPALHWLLNHEIYYPTLSELKNVKFVVGLKPRTSDAAEDVKENLFHDAKLVLLGSDTPEALFVFDSWDIGKCGLPYFHRVLLKDLHTRRGEALKLYATTLDVTISKKQKADIQAAGIELITATRSKYVDPKDDPVQLLWLFNYKCYYGNLKDLQNIKYVVGYAPKTCDAAASIRNDLFPYAKLYQINHFHPQYCQLTSRERERIDMTMLRAAEEADAVVSIGPSMHEHFENEYRAIPEKSVLHVELIPKVGEEFTVQDIQFPQNIHEHVVLSYGEVLTENALEEFKTKAAAISNVTTTLKNTGLRPPRWNIYVAGVQNKEAFRTCMAENTQGDFLDLRTTPEYSPTQLVTYLHRCHLCVVAENPAEYGFLGLEAMLMGLPSLVDKDSQLGYLVDTKFKRYAHSCLVNKKDQWFDRVMDVVSSPHLALECAMKLKTDYLCSKDMEDSYSRFASLFSEESTPSNDLDVIVKLDKRPWRARLEDLKNEFDRLSREAPDNKVAIDAVAKRMMDLADALKRCQQSYKRKAAKVVEEEHHLLKKQLTEGGYGVHDVGNLSEGSLRLSCNFLSFINLYTFKSTCKNGRLASSLEPLLVTEEMKREAAIVELPLHLQVVYDEEMFQAVESYLIQSNHVQSAPKFARPERELRSPSDNTDQGCAGEAYPRDESDILEFDEGYGESELGSDVDPEELEDNMKKANVTEEKVPSTEVFTVQGEEKKYIGSRLVKLKRFVQHLMGYDVNQQWYVRILGQQKSGKERELFNNPHGLRWHHDQLLICDTDNNRIQVLDKHCKWVDEIRFDDQFPKAFQPWAVAIYNENYHITDIGNNQVIICDKRYNVIQHIAHNEDILVYGIAILAGNALVTDHKGNSILKYTEEGGPIARCEGGISDDARMGYPYSVVATNNRVLVSDAKKHNIKVFDSDLSFVTAYCSEGTGKGEVRYPLGMDVDACGNIYICDKLNNRIVKLGSHGQFICHLFYGDLENPMDIAVNGTGDAIAVSMFGDIARPVNQIRVFFKH